MLLARQWQMSGRLSADTAAGTSGSRHTSIRSTAAGTQWQGVEGVERSSCVQLH